MRLLQFKFVSMGLILFALLSFSFNYFPPEKEVNNFHLKNTDGKTVSLSDYKDAKGYVIVFTCNHCPFAKLYFQRLNELNSKYKSLGIPVMAISSTDTVTYEDDGYLKMVEKSKAEKFNFPYLLDAEQSVAKNFGAQKTPHAFVIWKVDGSLKIKYNGAIDDNGAEPNKIQHPYLSDAIEALLSNKEIKFVETKSIGCQIHFRK
jgi:peroxiredoxin